MAEETPTRSPSPARRSARVVLFVLLLAGLLGVAQAGRKMGEINGIWKARGDDPRLNEERGETCAVARVPHGIFDLELAFTKARAGRIIDSWRGRPAGSTAPAKAECPSLVPLARESLALARRLVPGYFVALTALCLLAGGAFRASQRRPWHVVTALPALAALLDLGQIALLERVLDGAYGIVPLASLAASAKLVLLGTTLIAAVIVGFAWLGKRLSAASTRPAAPFSTVLDAERRYLERRRELAEVPARDHRLGLALSGGGIRSATVNLGVLQALARHRVLPQFDYLSTVSGGGYIGSALSSLLSISRSGIGSSPEGLPGQYRFARTPDGAEEEAWFATQPERFPFNERDERGRGDGRGFGGADQMRHLRAAGEFLVGRREPFSLEMLRAVGSVLGGIVYHLLHFLLFLTAFAAGYWWLVFQWGVGARATRAGKGSIDESTTLLEQYRELVGQAFGLDLGLESWWQHPFLDALVIGFVTTSITLALAYLLLPRLPDDWFSRPGLTTGHSRNLAAVRAMVLVMVVVVGFSALPTWFRLEYPDQLLNISIPLMSYLGGGACLGLLHGWVKMSRRFKRSQRSRVAAQEGAFVIVVGVSLVLVLLILPSLVLFEPVMRFLGERPVGSLFGWLLTLLGAGLFAGGDGSQAQGMVGRLLARFPGLRRASLSAVVLAAVVGAFLLISAGIWNYEPLGGLDPALPPGTPGPASFRMTVCLVALGLFLLTGLLNFNRLALHFFYHDRLSEAYLNTATSSPEAGNALRLLRNNEAQRLEDLHGRRQDGPAEECVTSAPYHLLVTCLNLSADERPSQATRKTDRFVFSRLYCGSETTGYEKTTDYRDGRTRLADAMTISGAAASPSMGRRTFFAQSAAMTLFNVRLGQWFENPAFRDGTSPRRIRFWSPYLLKELLGSSSADGRMVYLSDGGHSGDNLGVYPLLARRCRLIVAIDAERDSDHTCNSLVEALRQIQIDDGTTVAIELDRLRPDPATGSSASHFVEGRITYPDGERGRLVVIKSSLTGDEPEMIANYKRNNAAFPHESTGDLFFDDGQFEAYRQLGEHMVDSLLAAHHVCRPELVPVAPR